ncbi:MAG: adenylyl-sulfate kinase [Bacteroidetes bacterium]|nr:adenylyl-sulfate kinase [Bacteroidota bacterium]
MAFLLWITGLAGSGKTTIAKKVYSKMKKKHPASVFLDGDDFRSIMQDELGFDLKDRKKNAWRIARLCSFLTSQGVNVVCSTMSLYREIHTYNRKHNKKYYEVFIDVDMQELIKRNKKGLYSLAIKGEMKNVTGIDLPFDKPQGAVVFKNNNLKEVKLNAEKIYQLIK